MTKPPRPENEPFDVALLGGKTDDGGGVRVLRLRPDGASLGEIRPLQEGRPIQGEVVQLKPRSDAPWVCDVDVAVPAPTAPAALPTAAPPASAAPTPRPSSPSAAPPERHGPAQVATPAYRSNWDRIFGAKKSGGELNLTLPPNAPGPAPRPRERRSPRRRVPGIDLPRDVAFPESTTIVPTDSTTHATPRSAPSIDGTGARGLSGTSGHSLTRRTATRGLVATGRGYTKPRPCARLLHERCGDGWAGLSWRHETSHRLASPFPVIAPGV